jgi:hypothetical protein
MAGVALGFFPKWIARDDRLPFFCATNHKVRANTESLLSLRLQQSLEVGAKSPVASKNQVPALE